MWGSLKEKFYQIYTHVLEELKNNTGCEVSTIYGEAFSSVNNYVFRRHTECIPPGDKIFNICCSTSEVVLAYLEVIITAMFCVADQLWLGASGLKLE
jgi:hypothetical protein